MSRGRFTSLEFGFTIYDFGFTIEVHRMSNAFLIFVHYSSRSIKLNFGITIYD